jgi:hypothetical protein
MKEKGKMSYKYFVVNTLLCFVVLLLAFKNYQAWNHSIESSAYTGIMSKKSETKNENPPMMASTKEPMSIQSYKLVPEKNIFNPERKEFPTPPVAMAEAQKPIVRPQIVLYGVAIAGDYQSAIVSNPGRSLRKEARESLTIEIGEKIGEYKLAKVLPDRIAMEGNGDTFEVLLYDSKNQKKRMELTTEAKPTDNKPVMIASPQPARVRPSGEAAKSVASQESVQELKETIEKVKKSVQGEIPRSLPFNKYTYQLFPPSAVISRGTISYPPPGSSTQESVGK